MYFELILTATHSNDNYSKAASKLLEGKSMDELAEHTSNMALSIPRKGFLELLGGEYSRVQ